TEACFSELIGVISVKSGFTGGHTEKPTYEQVCSGATGHAEVAQIIFDSEKLSFQDLLKVFWFIHDPTQLNRQGNDIGTHYRSAIFYHDAQQEKQALAFKEMLNTQDVWDDPVVTEITRFTEFHPAESYHDDYLKNNPNNMYCQAVVRPKLDKFRQVFTSSLK
ncbi:peptide-methionine (S)-S-oxide reductase MsrA, partial [Crocinitomicaceae bacterium]|nr:peptide-methionine (S)-S-oxide reductase MsrA [Crocinitomicaceae bacterium]